MSRTTAPSLARRGHRVAPALLVGGLVSALVLTPGAALAADGPDAAEIAPVAQEAPVTPAAPVTPTEELRTRPLDLPDADVVSLRPVEPVEAPTPAAVPVDLTAPVRVNALPHATTSVTPVAERAARTPAPSDAEATTTPEGVEAHLIDGSALTEKDADNAAAGESAPGAEAVVRQTHTFATPRHERDVAGTEKTGGTTHHWPQELVTEPIQTWLGAPERCGKLYTVRTDVMEGTYAQFDAALNDGVLQRGEGQGGANPRTLSWVVTLPDAVSCIRTMAAAPAGEQSREDIPGTSGGPGEQAGEGTTSATAGSEGRPEGHEENGAVVVQASAAPHEAPAAAPAVQRTAVHPEAAPQRAATDAAPARLARTGAQVGLMLAIGAGLAVAGSGLLALRRRA